jgi:hypothetical protein
MIKIIKYIIRMVFNMFTKNSGLVKIWVTMILNGTYTYDQVPNLSNLRTVVFEVLLEVGYDPRVTA